MPQYNKPYLKWELLRLKLSMPKSRKRSSCFFFSIERPARGERQDLCSQKDIIKIFVNLGIRTSIYKNRILLKNDLDIYLWFIKNKIFEGHNNRKKLIKSILINYHIRSLYDRFNGHDFYTAKDLSEEFKLNKSTAYMFLFRNKRRGFLTSKGGYFTLTNKGQEFIEIINEAKIEFTNLCKLPSDQP